ncbi:hypothetical protein BU25DRAFT_21550 [Macroventuria anomochaeta]|uniref:Uncharacterized protein n=1 Tax=Macroventuria anomochaeta TaxID=301207 RepID=A0ACB6S571_9PLEO|nr:uncharacterized protein BU25DRAFT_21550 [Macroventuria anomochaeta]KAF2629406.1 hypothetical protein BU25DRAFT_21550 [Macroventuria anomochaeta]
MNTYSMNPTILPLKTFTTFCTPLPQRPNRKLPPSRCNLSVSSSPYRSKSHFAQSPSPTSTATYYSFPRNYIVNAPVEHLRFLRTRTYEQVLKHFVTQRSYAVPTILITRSAHPRCLRRSLRSLVCQSANALRMPSIVHRCTTRWSIAPTESGAK